MDDETLAELIERRWTAAELVEFLDIDIQDIVSAFQRKLRRNLPAILEEIGYEEESEDE